MAEHTDQNLLHQVIYSVFVRNHTKRRHLPRVGG